MLLAVAGEEQQQELWAQQLWEDKPLLSHATAASSLAVINVLMRAGAREHAGPVGRRPSESIEPVFAGRGEPTQVAVQVAAVLRMLLRGPAYRARSMA